MNDTDMSSALTPSHFHLHLSASQQVPPRPSVTFCYFMAYSTPRIRLDTEKQSKAFYAEKQHLQHMQKLVAEQAQN